MIVGFETYELVLAQLAALENEYPKNEAHAEQIAEQVAIFSEEADRYEAEESAKLEAEYATRAGFIQRRKARKRP
jgi:hypothetical protein